MIQYCIAQYSCVCAAYLLIYMCGSRSARAKVDARVPSQAETQVVLSERFKLCGRKITQHENGRSLPVRPTRPAMAGM